MQIVSGVSIVGRRLLPVTVAMDDGKTLWVKVAKGEEVVSTRFLLPGFVDGHVHLFGIARAKKWVNLKGASSLWEVARRLRRGKPSKSGIVFGRGYDDSLFSDVRNPTGTDLSRLLGGIPAVAVRVCGHKAIATEEAMAIMGIESEEGVLIEKNLERAYRFAPEASEKDIIECAFELARKGIRAVCEMGASEGEAQMLLNVGENMPIDVFVYIKPEAIGHIKGKSGRVRIVGVKVVYDGSLGAKTAALLEPYVGEGSRGTTYVEKRELLDIIKEAEGEGLQVAVHAIGDRALMEVVEAFEETRPTNPRVEHAQVTFPGAIRRMVKCGAAVCLQPRFFVDDQPFAGRFLGKERLKRAYLLRSFVEGGIHVFFGSDAPVSTFDPVMGILGAVENRIRPEESVDLETALFLYTDAACYSVPGLAKGLSVGKRVNLVIYRGRFPEEWARGPEAVIINGAKLR